MGKINPRQNEPKQQNLKWKETMKEVFEMTSVRIFDLAVVAFINGTAKRTNFRAYELNLRKIDP